MSNPSKPQINYCKAYLLSRLEDYPQWPTDIPTESAPSGMVFVHSDYVVRNGPEADDLVIFNQASADWKAFCKDQLQFDQTRAAVMPDHTDD